MTENGFDNETGEVAPSISQRALNQMHDARAAIQHPDSGRSLGIKYALHKAMAELPTWITTDATGAHQVKYASLKAILQAVRPILQKHDIRIRQGCDFSRTSDEGGGVKGRIVPVYTDLIHGWSGEVERTVIEIPITRMDPQSMGSAVTYGRRYSILAALALATDESDDDGMAAQPKDLTTSMADTPGLTELKSEIDEIISKDKESAHSRMDKLTKWGIDPKVRKRMNQLSEGELERLRSHYTGARDVLNEAA